MRHSFHRLITLIWLILALFVSYGPAGAFVVCVEQAGNTHIEPAGPDGRCALDSAAAQSSSGDDCRECIDLAFQTDVGPHTPGIKDVSRLCFAPAVSDTRHSVNPADPGFILRNTESLATRSLPIHLQSTVLLI